MNLFYSSPCWEKGHLLNFCLSLSYWRHGNFKVNKISCHILTQKRSGGQKNNFGGTVWHSAFKRPGFGILAELQLGSNKHKNLKWWMKELMDIKGRTTTGHVYNPPGLLAMSPSCRFSTFLLCFSLYTDGYCCWLPLGKGEMGSVCPDMGTFSSPHPHLPCLIFLCLAFSWFVSRLYPATVMPLVYCRNSVTHLTSLYPWGKLFCISKWRESRSQLPS